MSTTTRLTFEQFEKLPEQEGVHYELDEGELLMEPIANFSSTMQFVPGSPNA